MHFGAPEGSAVTIKNRAKPSNTEEIPAQYVPGFERVIYERLIPMAFNVPVSPGFNMKDGQTVTVRRFRWSLLHVVLRFPLSSWWGRLALC